MCDFSFTSVRKNGPGDFTLLVASAKEQVSAKHSIDFQDFSAILTVEYGDFARPLQRVVSALQEVRDPS